ncbi:hypothetical protein [Saccharopolyspora sp. ASAGF58]|uniref:hypothetical protein n=1 Tax=Saccharopolyspora sp. ASAGF58 TaxID=2719023 RepID=UPI00143FEA96|nr:hypothetical protein [Saccharopolyspora sp. ASAGF58]QIZ38562.1 hypothetical protein FDZ84_33580 [Saccharopolyspora sp. ASAGF58]
MMLLDLGTIRVRDARSAQHCWVERNADGYHVTGQPPFPAVPDTVGSVDIDWVDDTSSATAGSISAVLAPITVDDWQEAAHRVWPKWQPLSGMPSGLRVVSIDGENEILLGEPGCLFTIFGPDRVLSRLFSGDVLFDEVLFANLIRIVGGLGQVSVLIGASMREAFDGFLD